MAQNTFNASTLKVVRRGQIKGKQDYRPRNFQCGHEHCKQRCDPKIFEKQPVKGVAGIVPRSCANGPCKYAVKDKPKKRTR